MNIVEILKSMIHGKGKNQGDVAILLNKSRATVCLKFKKNSFTTKELEKILNSWFTSKEINFFLVSMGSKKNE